MNIKEVRESNPKELSGASDQQVVDFVHQKYYADLPREQVADALGVTSTATIEVSASQPDPAGGKTPEYLYAALIGLGLLATYLVVDAALAKIRPPAEKFAASSRKRPMAAIGLVAVLAMVSVAIYWAAGPWSVDQCMAEAANKPTDRGVSLAAAECRRMFPGPH
jgi:hypothetical protein